MGSKDYYDSLDDGLRSLAELRAAFDLLWYNSALGFGDTHPFTEATFLCAARVVGSHVRLNISVEEWGSVWQGLMRALIDGYAGDMRAGVMEEAFKKWINDNDKYFKHGIQDSSRHGRTTDVG